VFDDVFSWATPSAGSLLVPGSLGSTTRQLLGFGDIVRGLHLNERS